MGKATAKNPCYLYISLFRKYENNTMILLKPKQPLHYFYLSHYFLSKPWMNTICYAQPWAQCTQVFSILCLIDCLWPIRNQIPSLPSSYFLSLTSSTYKLVLPISWSHQLVLTKTMIKLVPPFLLLKEIWVVKISEFFI